MLETLVLVSRIINDIPPNPPSPVNVPFDVLIHYCRVISPWLTVVSGWDYLATKYSEDIAQVFKSLGKTAVPLLSFTSFHWGSGVEIFPCASRNMQHLEQAFFPSQTPSLEQGVIGNFMPISPN
jgi:hypothetical protein